MRQIRIIITRTLQAAGPLIQELTDCLATYRTSIVCAPVRVAAFDESCLKDAAFENLLEQKYRWITFTSVNAVSGLVQALDQKGQSLPALLKNTGVACVGLSTAKALKKIGVEADFIPDVQDAAHMVAQWPGISQEASEATENIQRVLCIQGANARDILSRGLTERGLEAETLTVYRMEKFPSPVSLTNHEESSLELPELTMDAVLPLLPQTDVLIATAPSLLKELVTCSLQKGEQVFPHVIAIGQTTGREAEKLGLSYTVAEHPQAKFLAQASKTYVECLSIGTQ